LKKKLTYLFVLLLITTLTMVLGGCGGNSQEAEEQKKETQKPETVNMVHASGPIGSGWYPISVLITDIWMNEYPEFNVSVIEGGAVENLRAVNNGLDAQTGLSFASDFADAVNGRGTFKDNKLEDLAILGCIYPSYLNIAVLKNSDITKIEDVVGKHLCPGKPGYSSNKVMQRVLQAYGITYEDIKKAGGKVSFGGYTDAANMLKDGIVDMAAALGAPNVTAFTEAHATKPIRLLPIPEEILKKLEKQEYGYTYNIPIPANTYEGQTEPVPTVTVLGVIIVDKNLDNDTVYKMTKALWENIDRIRKEQPVRGNEMSLERAYQGVPSALREYIHPGALKYYKEKGVTG